jgi:hypothetical protein
MKCWRKESVAHLANVALSELESISIDDEVGARDERRDGFPSKDPVFLRIRLDGLSLDMLIVRRGNRSESLLFLPTVNSSSINRDLNRFV